MKLVTKPFHQLTTTELYRILKARVDIFVVEQSCPYPELDNKDQQAVHLWLEEDDEILSYLRIFNKDETTAVIGRVIAPSRGTGCGGKILAAGIEGCQKLLGKDRIYIEAQCYARGFYEKYGFVAYGEEFLEDGIAHIRMLWEKR